MTTTLSATAPRVSATGAAPGSRLRAKSTEVRSHRCEQAQHELLGHYVDRCGRRREVTTQQGSAGSVLVVDRDALTRGDRRLVAHIAGDEPVGNAALVCAHYLQDGHGDRYRCPRVTAQDMERAPFSDPGEGESRSVHGAVQPVESNTCSYRLALCQGALSIPELRWQRSQRQACERGSTVVSLREAVADLESYEPLCSLTASALQAHGAEPEVSTTVLRLELSRVRESPIVLNRRLREVVLAALEREALSMSQIATRCGRVKHDRRGNSSGETSWLARRLGLLPEGGQSAPTPWIHSEVLGLIARRGLGVSPREVEL
jgi:hypothetical protein